MLTGIIEARYFARAFWTYKGARSKKDLPKDDPMINLVKQIEFDDARAKLAERDHA